MPMNDQTSQSRDILYCAEWVLPVSAPPVRSGAVLVREDVIAGIGPSLELAAANPQAEVVDFGPAVLMPGFVNAHCHLEYATFRGIFDDEEFGDWIVRLVDAKAALSPSDYVHSALLGAAECVSSGITTIADTAFGGETLLAASQAGLRGRLYLEVFGIDDRHLEQTMAEIEARLDGARAAASSRIEIGIAPHAPYTVSARLYQTIASYAREHDLKVASHVAESCEELTYIRSGSGKFAHDFREKVGWERMLVQPYGVSPIKYLQQWGVFDEDFLAVHCVQASPDDIRILASKRAAVAHCPKSNAKLGCGVAPLAEMLRQGVRVGFGTDSPASSNIMDMFDEMRTALFLHRAIGRDVSVLTAEKCIQIATLGAADALGMADAVGSLEPGKQADLIAVDISRSHFAPVTDPYSALVYGANQDDVTFACVGGDVLYRDRELLTLDAEAVRAGGIQVREKLHTKVSDGVSVGDVESGWWRPTDATVAGGADDSARG